MMTNVEDITNNIINDVKSYFNKYTCMTFIVDISNILFIINNYDYFVKIKKHIPTKKYTHLQDIIESEKTHKIIIISKFGYDCMFYNITRRRSYINNFIETYIQKNPPLPDIFILDVIYEYILNGNEVMGSKSSEYILDLLRNFDFQIECYNLLSIIEISNTSNPDNVLDMANNLLKCIIMKYDPDDANEIESYAIVIRIGAIIGCKNWFDEAEFNKIESWFRTVKMKVNKNTNDVNYRKIKSSNSKEGYSFLNWCFAVYVCETIYNSFMRKDYYDTKVWE